MRNDQCFCAVLQKVYMWQQPSTDSFHQNTISFYLEVLDRNIKRLVYGYCIRKFSSLFQLGFFILHFLTKIKKKKKKYLNTYIGFTQVLLTFKWLGFLYVSKFYLYLELVQTVYLCSLFEILSSFEWVKAFFMLSIVRIDIRKQTLYYVKPFLVSDESTEIAIFLSIL